MTLSEFLASPQRNAWLTMEEPFAMYARKAHRLIQGEKQYTFDIAIIEVQEEMRGTGVLKRFLPQMGAIAKEHGFDGIFVESIQEPGCLIS
jgi:N-acetylglutamate synthase-like GNAT family acetyltransferase